jgi:hypothetical protein
MRECENAGMRECGNETAVRGNGGRGEVRSTTEGERTGGEQTALGGDANGPGKRRATSDERRATSDERRAAREGGGDDRGNAR